MAFLKIGRVATIATISALLLLPAVGAYADINIVSNLNQTTENGGMTPSDTSWDAERFIMGNTAANFTSATLALSVVNWPNNNPGGTVSASLWSAVYSPSDFSYIPKTQLADLGSNTVTSVTEQDLTFTAASPVALSANMNYFIVVSGQPWSDNKLVAMVGTSSSAYSSDIGASLSNDANGYGSSDGGNSWSIFAAYSWKMSIQGAGGGSSGPSGGGGQGGGGGVAPEPGSLALVLPGIILGGAGFARRFRRS